MIEFISWRALPQCSVQSSQRGRTGQIFWFPSGLLSVNGKTSWAPTVAFLYPSILNLSERFSSPCKFESKKTLLEIHIGMSFGLRAFKKSSWRSFFNSHPLVKSRYIDVVFCKFQKILRKTFLCIIYIYQHKLSETFIYAYCS